MSAPDLEHLEKLPKREKVPRGKRRPWHQLHAADVALGEAQAAQKTAEALPLSDPMRAPAQASAARLLHDAHELRRQLLRRR